MDSELSIFMLVFWVVINTIVGAIVGQKKHRTPEGVALGLLLGPLGWIVMALAPGHGPKCPECKGDIPAQARKCKHCGSDVTIQT